MKVVLLPLSGSVETACESLRRRKSDAQIEVINRAEIEKGSLFQRIKALRAHDPELLAISTERLRFQWGQNALLLLGALSGARRLLLLDAHGSSREESRTRALAMAAFRFAYEALVSAWTVIQSRVHLRQLERSARFKHCHAELPRTQNQPLTIAYLRATPVPATLSGGASTHLNGVVNALLEKGAQVWLLSNDQIPGLGETKMLPIILPQPIGATRATFDLHHNLRFTREATKALERSRPDFIYQRYSRFSWSGAQASLQTGCPLFLEYNGSEVWIGKHWDRRGMLDLLARSERLNLQTAARIFVVSEVERANLLGAGIAEEKIIVNPNGVDTERFKPGVGGPAERKRFEISQDEIVFGFVGTFGPWHGVIKLAEAITSMPSGERARFLFVGDGSLRAVVERMLDDAGVTDRVLFTGAVPHKRVPALLDACDVLISPHIPLVDGSEFFGSPTKLFEYMAMGKAIISSRLGQIAKVLSHEETAILVAPGDVGELKSGMLRLAHSPDLRERLGKNARSIAIERYTWAHNANRVLDTYNSWLNGEKMAINN